MNISNIGLKLKSQAPMDEQPVPKLKLKLKLHGIKNNESMVQAVLIKEKIKWDEQLIPTSNIPNFQYPFEYLNPPQSEFYVNRFLDSNFIVSAATSSGKTVIAELARNGKFLYLSPLKAISQEKYEDWTSPEHSWSQQKVAICTGDYMLTADRVQEMRNADIIIMTSEMLDSRSRNMTNERNDWLKDIKTLIIDEFHLIGSENRGDKLESALIRFTEQNSDCRLICLSATMPNVGQIAAWLTKLNGKETNLIISNYRPVELKKHYPTYLQSRDYSETELIKLQMARRIVQQNIEDKFIVFVHSKIAGYKMVKMFEDYSVKCEFHNADLTKEERIKLQGEFNSNRKGSLRVLIATSTLAWGVNTPADSVVIVGLHRGINLVSNLDIHQMCGRAGRIGKTAKGIGNAFVLVPDKDTERFVEYCEKISDIYSRMNIKLDDGLETLCFHIVAEILGGFVNDAETLIRWYDRTLAKFQDVILDIEDAQLILDKLEEIKMIRKNEIGTYYATGLGKVSAYLYYSPFDIYSWFRNFTNILNNNMPINPITLSWAVANIDSNSSDYVPKYAQEEADRWKNRAKEYNLFASSCSHICAAYYHLFNGTDYYPQGLTIFKRQAQMGIDRAVQALKLIDSLYMRWRRDDLWERIQMQVKYGIGEHLLELVRLPGIGAKRATNLYEAGIKSIAIFKEKPSIVKGVIGSNLFESIMTKLNDSDGG
jgi:helicase